MAQRKIVWTPTAENYFNEILDYYHEVTASSKYGKFLSEKIDKAILNIKSFNLLCKLTDFSNIRFFIYPPCEIFYRVTENIISIELIWDLRRNPEDLKKLLKS